MYISYIFSFLVLSLILYCNIRLKKKQSKIIFSLESFHDPLILELISYVCNLYKTRDTNPLLEISGSRQSFLRLERTHKTSCKWEANFPRRGINSSVEKRGSKL